MKKILFVGLIGLMSVSGANAGWFSDLFSAKPAEPQTLAEACNIDEISAVCPEIILGQKTLIECLTDNVKTVSQKCLDYVKKAVAENSSEITELTNQIKSATADKAADASNAAEQKAESVKAQITEKVNAAKLEIAQKLIASANAEQ